MERKSVVMLKAFEERRLQEGDMLYILQLVFVAYSAASLVLELFECFTEPAVSS